MFHSSGLSMSGHSDVNYEVVLTNCNAELTAWMDTWKAEMQRGLVLVSSLGINADSTSSRRGNISFFLLKLLEIIRPAVPQFIRGTG